MSQLHSSVLQVAWVWIQSQSSFLILIYCHYPATVHLSCLTVWAEKQRYENTTVCVKKDQSSVGYLASNEAAEFRKREC